jgi:hypothetical protein
MVGEFRALPIQLSIRWRELAMTMSSLRKSLGKVAGGVALLGVVVFALGLWLNNSAMVGLGLLFLFGGGYTAVFSRVGSF